MDIPFSKKMITNNFGHPLTFLITHVWEMLPLEQHLSARQAISMKYAVDIPLPQWMKTLSILHDLSFSATLRTNVL